MSLVLEPMEIEGSEESPLQYRESAWERWGRYFICECGARTHLWAQVVGSEINLPCIHCKKRHKILFVKADNTYIEDNWREYIIQTVPHPAFAGKKLGDLSYDKLNILKTAWLDKLGKDALLLPNSSGTIPRHLDILNICEAVKILI